MNKIKETPIVIFYILYFFWLFTITYLTPETNILNYFTAGVSLFYFIFLREKGDFFWFLIAATIPIIMASTTFTNWEFKFDLIIISLMPLWLPLAWGTTIVALRKFYIVIAG